MADSTVWTSGKDRRLAAGPRAVGELVRDVSRAAVARGESGLGHLRLDWAAVVGPALAAVTEPRRFINGTLTIGCAGPIALELQHMALELMARINSYLGGQPVRIVRVVQGPVVGAPVAIRSPVRSHEPKRPRIEGFPDGPLKDALECLGGHLNRPATVGPMDRRAPRPRT